MFVLVLMKGELSKMTENEMELINMIREAGDSGEALMEVAVIILGFLKQHESFEEASSVCLQGQA